MKKNRIFLLFLMLITLLLLVACSQTTVEWRNTNGTLLYTEKLDKDESIPTKELPEDTEKWDYIEWDEKKDENKVVYTAVRKPQESYFVGNVFQIIVKDLGETPVATGSAFVFHKDGWFITNAHVMENAYYAQAIFNIPNSVSGESFTYLSIIGGSYYHLDKDIYIGKIENYSSIQSYYNEISINLNYEIGGKTYSVGYPESSTELILSEGIITENWSDLYEKLYSGNSYICSTSYIAPGSSGGILVNENLEVIGITTLGWTDKKDNFINGAAISAFNFTGLLNTNTNNLIPLLKQFHEDEMVYICFFNGARFDEETERIVFDDGTIGYEYRWITEGKADDNTMYYSEEFLTIASDGYIEYTSEAYWENSHRRTIDFYGYFLGKNSFSDFVYEFDYEWETGNYFGIYCDSVNYSENIALTLNKYEISKKSYNYSVSQLDIEYAKENFNRTYEWLTDWMEEFE